MNHLTLLMRQVHPQFFEDDELSSQAFIVFPRDNGSLSVYDGDQSSAEDSHRHYTGILGLQSVGVWAVNGEEVVSVGLTYQSEPVEGNQAHAGIVFGARAKGECRRLAKLLRQFAVDRGSLYRAA